MSACKSVCVCVCLLHLQLEPDAELNFLDSRLSPHVQYRHPKYILLEKKSFKKFKFCDSSVLKFKQSDSASTSNIIHWYVNFFLILSLGTFNF